MTRTVVVQPSAYGTDNSCQLDAVAKLGTNDRTVVVVDTTVTDHTLENLTAAGAVFLWIIRKNFMDSE